ncbi:MAG: hypothetical protein ACI8RZ_003598 [Myxococcota bacterium]|jgi:hypothetical protein
MRSLLHFTALILSGCIDCKKLGCGAGDGYARFDLWPHYQSFEGEQGVTYTFTLAWDGGGGSCVAVIGETSSCDSAAISLEDVSTGTGDGTWSSIAAVHLSQFPEQVALTIEREGVVVHEDVYEIDPETSYPNGEECDEECFGWTAEVSDWGKYDRPCTTEQRGDSTYHLCPTPMPWTEAATQCAQLGARLVSIEDEGENDWLDPLVDATSEGLWWTGGSDLDEEGVWTWEGAGEMTWTAWGPTEPNNWDGVEHCMHLNFYTDGAWDDTSCDGERPYVCESP